MDITNRIIMNTLRDWYYSPRRVEVQTSKEFAEDVIRVLDTAGFVIVRKTELQVGEQSPVCRDGNPGSGHPGAGHDASSQSAAVQDLTANWGQSEETYKQFLELDEAQRRAIKALTTPIA